MLIEIIDPELAESEPLQAALNRVLWHQNVRKATIYVNERVPDDAPEWEHPEWLEYGIRFDYSTGGKLFVGMIQRKRGEPFEFHS